MPDFSVSLGDYGSIGIEVPGTASSREVEHDSYGGLCRSSKAHHSLDQRSKPIRNFRPNHTKDAELPYLRTRLVCHVDCDRLSPSAKRALFASTREQAKEGYILSRIKQEVIDALRSDDDLIRLNREARDQSLSEKDEEAKKRLQRDVARMLNLRGKAQVDTSKATQKGSGGGVGGGGGNRRKVEPLDTREPPTYILILHEADEPIRFHGGQRRWIRIETDATSDTTTLRSLRTPA